MSIVQLGEAADSPLYGGKAAGLCRAIRAGLAVPPGIAVSWTAAERIAAGQPDAEGLLRSKLAALRMPVAVRSSGAAEDGAAASYAGVFKTILNVAEADRVVSAVREVYASAIGGRTMAYRAGSGNRRPRMAVLVQEMAAADAAGVLFTRHPVTGADIRLIEAAWGLGESVVAGRVTPDRYACHRGRSFDVEASMGEKETAIRLLPEGGTVEEAVAEADRRRYCLTAEQLQALDALACDCERLYGPGLDIEWAWSAGRLFLLQCRPITV